MSDLNLSFHAIHDELQFSVKERLHQAWDDDYAYLCWLRDRDMLQHFDTFGEDTKFRSGGSLHDIGMLALEAQVQQISRLMQLQIVPPETWGIPASSWVGLPAANLQETLDEARRLGFVRVPREGSNG